MGKAAYDEAKKNGELMSQRLRKPVAYGPVGAQAEREEAADLIDWLNRERDSLIAEVTELRTKANVSTAVIDKALDEDYISNAWLQEALTGVSGSPSMPEIIAQESEAHQFHVCPDCGLSVVDADLHELKCKGRDVWFCPMCGEPSDANGLVTEHKESCCHFGSALAPPATAATECGCSDDRARCPNRPGGDWICGCDCHGQFSAVDGRESS